MSEFDGPYLSAQDFIDRGYLHEINRLILHPLGLALQVNQPQGTTEKFVVSIWDCQNDRSGIEFHPDTLDADKAGRVFEELMARKRDRMEALHYVIQPVEGRQVLVTNYTDPGANPDDVPGGPVL